MGVHQGSASDSTHPGTQHVLFRAVLSVLPVLLCPPCHVVDNASAIPTGITVRREKSWLVAHPAVGLRQQRLQAALSSHTKTPLDDSARPDQPSFDELVETVAGLCGCLLTPQAGANLEAGKALMRRKIAEAQAQVTERNTQ